MAGSQKYELGWQRSREITDKFGSEAKMLTTSLLRAFKSGQLDSPSRAAVDFVIASRLAADIENNIIRLNDRNSRFPVFVYGSKNKPLFRIVKDFNHGLLPPCFTFDLQTLGEEDEVLLRPDPLVGEIIKAASNSHLSYGRGGKQTGPTFEYFEVNEPREDLEAQEDLMAHIVIATFNTFDYVRGNRLRFA